MIFGQEGPGITAEASAGQSKISSTVPGWSLMSKVFAPVPIFSMYWMVEGAGAFVCGEETSLIGSLVLNDIGRITLRLAEPGRHLAA